MTTLVLKSNSSNDIKAIRYFADRLGITVQLYTEKEIEDISLLNAMEQGRKEGYVSRDEIMKTLKKNGSKIR